MKKLLVSLVLLTGFAVIANAEVKVETLTWFDYYSKSYTNQATTNVNLGVNAGGKFALSRQYVTVQGDIGKDIIGSTIKARVTLDLAKPSTPVKFAYVEYNIAGLNLAVLTAGMMKPYILNLQDWNYQLPWKDAAEMYTTSKSADLGVGLSGKGLPIEGLTKNLLGYNISFVNGVGYDTADYATTVFSNGNFGFNGNIYVMPIDGVTIGASIFTKNYSTPATWWAINNDFAYGFYVAAKNVMDVPFDFIAEYGQETKSTANVDVTKSNTIVTNNFIALVAGFNVTKALGIDFGVMPYVRMDIINNNLSKTNNITNGLIYQDQILYAGIDLLPIANLTIKPFISYSLVNGTMEAWIQTEYKCNFSIWQ